METILKDNKQNKRWENLRNVIRHLMEKEEKIIIIGDLNWNDMEEKNRVQELFNLNIQSTQKISI